MRVGTPLQGIQVILDTGGSETWLPSPEMIRQRGQTDRIPQVKYNRSSTAVNATSHEELPYGPEGKSLVKVDWFEDYIQFGVEEEEYIFKLANRTIFGVGVWSNSLALGIMGLAAAGSYPRNRSLMEQMVAQKRLAWPGFTVVLERKCPGQPH